MGVVFVTFDEIGYACIEEIIKKDIEISAIITLKDDLLKERSGYKFFDDLAEQNKIELLKIKNINDKDVINKIEEFDPSVLFVIGWSQLIKKEVISIPKYGCIGAHPTLLPKHRGRAPIPWAIINGLTKTGVTLFYIDEGADSGDIIDQDEIMISELDDASTLYDKTLKSHRELIKNNVVDIVNNTTDPRKQDEKRASYWTKRTPEDGIIDWNKKSLHLYDWIRALTKPYPGAFTFLNEEKIIIWKSKKIEDNNYDLSNFVPGEIIDVAENGLLVKTGNSILKLTKVEYKNEIIENNEFENYNKITKGDVLG